MKRIKHSAQTSFVLLLFVVTASCGTMSKGEVTPQSQGASSESVSKKAEEPCMAIIEWADFMMINNIKYYQNYDGTKAVTAEQLGDKIGEISYMLNEHACTDYVAKNGDAAFLPIGTVIYALKGYKSDFRVVADNKIYEVKDNPTIGAIYSGNYSDLLTPEAPAEVLVDGKNVNYSGQGPFRLYKGDGQLLVPLKDVAAAVAATVTDTKEGWQISRDGQSLTIAKATGVSFLGHAFVPLKSLTDNLGVQATVKERN